MPDKPVRYRLPRKPVPGLRALRPVIAWTRRALRLHLWFPHLPLALLLGCGSVMLLENDLGRGWRHDLHVILHGSINLPPRLLPSILVSGGLLTMAMGLLLRSRVAWTMALLLVTTAVFSAHFTGHHRSLFLPVYFVLVLAALLFSWRHFDRASLAASTLFAVTAVLMLLIYATFGSFYLGTEFKPAITDLATALYFAMVTMTTVGYGDITPQTTETRLFTVSVIVLGVAVFATSLTAVIAPLVSNSLRRIVSRGGSGMKRQDHFIVAGDTALAINTWRELAKRGRSVTRVLREAPEEGELSGVDVVVGDPGSVEVLKQAGAERAEAVLAMLADDSENAFVVLAVKEIGSRARTVAAVNEAGHLERIKLVQPDVVIAPQVLGGELMAMLLSGEAVTPEFVLQRVFQQTP